MIEDYLNISSHSCEIIINDLTWDVRCSVLSVLEIPIKFIKNNKQMCYFNFTQLL